MEKKRKMSWTKPWRWAKTLFFLFAMVASLLVCCAPPLLVAVLDVLLPASLFSASFDPPFSLPVLASQLKSYSFQASLVDVPLVSIARSLLILCVYGVCDGRGPYLGITTMCSILSVGYVSLKAVYMFGVGSMQGRSPHGAGGKDGVVLVESLFLSSLALGMAHIVAAYRTSCRERRKLLVYRIDIEAVSAYKSDIPSYKKIALSK